MVGKLLCYCFLTALLFSYFVECLASKRIFTLIGPQKWNTYGKTMFSEEFDPLDQNITDSKKISKSEDCLGGEEQDTQNFRCKDGYAPTNGLCCLCDKNCSETERCFFEEDTPVCLCLPGYVRNGEDCQECQCDENEICSFDENGVKVCQCVQGYVRNATKCEECKCGENEVCSFKNGKQVCSCEDGYIEQNRVCTDCGCSIDNRNEECYLDSDGKPGCRCKNNFAEFLSQCQECTCEDEIAVCLFDDDGRPSCHCPEGYIEKGDRCIEDQSSWTTEVTVTQNRNYECGENELWSSDENGLFACHCPSGYAKDGKKCRDCGCDIDLHEECFLDYSGEPRCRCRKNYSVFMNVCIECHCQDENAVCFFDDEMKHCKCREGFVQIGEACIEKVETNPTSDEGTTEKSTTGFSTTGMLEPSLTSDESTRKRSTSGFPIVDDTSSNITAETVGTNPTSDEGTTEKSTTAFSTTGMLEPSLTSDESTRERSTSGFPIVDDTSSKTTAGIPEVNSSTYIGTTGTMSDKPSGSSDASASTATDADAKTISTSVSSLISTESTSVKVIDLCSSNPCKFNGTCEPQGINYKCTCLLPYVGDNCEKVSCEPNPCLGGNCTLISETEFKCSCDESNEFSSTYGCRRDLYVSGADSNMLSIVAGSVTGISILVLILIFSGLKIRRRRKRQRDGFYIQDSESSSQCSRECQHRSPMSREIPDIL